MDQPEFGLPSRDYYFQKDTRVLNAYYKFMIDVAEILGVDRVQAEKDLSDVLKFEQQLANVWSRI